MPNTQTVEALLASRLTRSLDAWRERLDRQLREHGTGSLTLLRISRHDDAISEAELAQMEKTLPIRLLWHIGGAHYVAKLTDPGHQTQLALEGHLDVQAGEYRLTAI